MFVQTYVALAFVVMCIVCVTAAWVIILGVVRKAETPAQALNQTTGNRPIYPKLPGPKMKRTCYAGPSYMLYNVVLAFTCQK